MLFHFLMWRKLKKKKQNVWWVSLFFWYGAWNQQECCICLSKYREKEEIRQLPCSHVFHLKCVDQWLRIISCCPLCKQELERWKNKIHTSREARNKIQIKSKSFLNFLWLLLRLLEWEYSLYIGAHQYLLSLDLSWSLLLRTSLYKFFFSNTRTAQNTGTWE